MDFFFASLFCKIRRGNVLNCVSHVRHDLSCLDQKYQFMWCSRCSQPSRFLKVSINPSNSNTKQRLPSSKLYSVQRYSNLQKWWSICVLFALQVSPKCASHVQRVMHQRAVDVHLMPEIQMNCIEDLAQHCNDRLNNGEVMKIIMNSLVSGNHRFCSLKCAWHLNFFC